MSVVVSAYTTRRLDQVLRCISSLKKQTHPPKEVILVLDPNRKLFKSYKSRVPSDVKIVLSSNVGLSHARNTGVRNATGDIVAFVDDDAEADEKWLENLVRNYEDPRVLGVGGFIKPLWDRNRPSWFPEELYWILGCSYKGLPENKAAIRNLIGCNMSFRKGVFDKVGSFSTEIGRVGSMLSGHEDTEFSIRLIEKIPGHKLIYDPQAVIHHRVPRSRARLKYVVRRSFSEGISKATFSNRKSSKRSTLDVERDYLLNMTVSNIPRRLTQGKPESVSQIFTLLLSTSLVLVGYFVGKNFSRKAIVNSST